jgi:hypothetical protein
VFPPALVIPDGEAEAQTLCRIIRRGGQLWLGKLG